MKVHYDPLTGITVTMGTTENEMNVALDMLSLLAEIYPQHHDAFAETMHAVRQNEIFEQETH